MSFDSKPFSPQKSFQYLAGVKEDLQHHKTSGAKGPREVLAFMAGIYGSLFSLFLCLVLQPRAVLLSAFWPVHLLLLLLGSAVLGVLVVQLVKRFSGMPATWAESLVEKLLCYQPIDAGAYQAMQRRVQAAGMLDPQLIQMWLSAEEQAVIHKITETRDESVGYLAPLINRKI